MKRREFITLLGGAAVGWPLGVRGAAVGDAGDTAILVARRRAASTARWSAFRQALRQLGLIEGQNVAIELRWARGGLQRDSRTCWPS